MCDVILIEVFAVIRSLEPELAKSSTLVVGPDDTIHPDESGQPDTVQTTGIKDSRGISDTFRKIYRLVSNTWESV